MDFSLIAASRGRYELLVQFIHSVFSKASSPELVELYLMTDEDDPKTREVIKRVVDKNPSWRIVVHCQPRSSNLNRDYINVAAALSTGKYLWVLGNDMEISTSGWDEILRTGIEGFVVADRLGYVYVDDEIHGVGVYGGCCSPLITRESYEACWMYMPPELPTWAADHWLWMIYQGLAENRIVDIHAVKVLHHSHHTGRVPQDEINKEVERNAGLGVLAPEIFEHYKSLLNNVILKAAAADKKHALLF